MAFSALSGLALVAVAGLSGVRAQEPCQSAADVIAAELGDQNIFDQALVQISNLPTDTPEGAAAAALVAQLRSTEPAEEGATLFVPNDDAFRSIQGARQLTPTELAQIVATHIADGEIQSTDINDGQEVPSQSEGDTLVFSTAEGVQVSVMGSAGEPATVTTPDLQSCAGVIHIVDTVLLPKAIADPSADGVTAAAMAPGPADGPADGPGMGPAMGPEDQPCISAASALLKNPNTTVLADILTVVLEPLVFQQLNDPAANLTIFAPPDAILTKVLGLFQNGTLTQQQVVDTLLYHVVDQYLPAEAVLGADGEMFTTLSAENITVMIEEGEEGDDPMIMIEGLNSTVMVTEPGIDACSDTAVIHAVDGILLAQDLGLPTDEEEIAALPDGDVDTLGAQADTTREALGLGDGPAEGPGSVADPGATGTRDIGAPAPEEAGEDGSAGHVIGGVAAACAAAVAAVAVF